MERHHTKDKGDVGTGMVIARLLAAGVQVALPLSEHLPFDLIAIGPRDELVKVSVKYRTLEARGVVRVEFRSVWADRHGTHTTVHKRTEYDALAIFCPDTSECYFVRMDEIDAASITLSVSEKGRWRASAFTDPMRLFLPA